MKRRSLELCLNLSFLMIMVFGCNNTAPGALSTTTIAPTPSQTTTQSTTTHPITSTFSTYTSPPSLTTTSPPLTYPPTETPTSPSGGLIEGDLVSNEMNSRSCPALSSIYGQEWTNSIAYGIGISYPFGVLHVVRLTSR